MCIAIYKPENKVIDKQTLENCYQSNPHSIGYAYVSRNKIQVKRFLDFNKFYQSYNSIQSRYKMMIHFRLSTGGQIDLINCHPFRINKNLAFCHNGIFDLKPTATHCDTKIFRSFLATMHDIDITCKGTRFLLDHYFSSQHSKGIFLDRNENVFIANEKRGEWHDNCWYSNYTYESSRVKYSTHFYSDNYYNDKWHTNYKKTNKKKATAIVDKELEGIEKFIDQNIGQIIYCGYCFEEIELDDIELGSCPYCNQAILSEYDLVSESDLIPYNGE